MKYIKLFETAAAFETARATLNLPNVSLVQELMNTTGGLTYTPYVAPPAPHNYANDYFTLVAIDDCYFDFTCGNGDDGKLSYSLDDGETWSEYMVTPNDYIYVMAGNKILFKGQNYCTSGNSCGMYPGFYVDRLERENLPQRFNVEGNIMSLLYGDNFVGQTELIDYANNGNIFTYLFYNNDSLINAENLILPATTLTSGCYSDMFYLCSSLITAPTLPATTLAEYCYSCMFYGCTSLTTAPELPATTLASGCYSEMFEECSLLNSITCLATDISASDCTYEWLNVVAQTGTFTKATSMSDWETGDSGIPEGWTVQDYTE